MRMVDIISKKRNGSQLSNEEIEFFIKGYTKGEIPDYQASALLMAIYFKGMSEAETIAITRAMAYSGDTVDLSHLPGIKVDKHSTGGVGDKTTLIVAPIVAACGVTVAKMSGRGLGHTGGTVDKLESIPGFKVELTQEEFYKIVKDIGISVVGQSGNLAPADKKLYALRDVTATVESIPLIAASIMSKKIAAGADAILLDVKIGSGAFLSDEEDGICLAEIMVKIGEGVGKKTVALITDMDRPLGNAIGNTLEVAEAVKTLQGNGSKDLTHLCKCLATEMLMLAGKGEHNECEQVVENVIASGSAFNKFVDMVKAQGGDTSCLYDTDKLPKAAYTLEVKAIKSGFITKMNTHEIGNISVILGAGRSKKDDPIDYTAGIMLIAKTGDYVKAGQAIAKLYTNNDKVIALAAEKYINSVTIEKSQVPQSKLIYAKVTSGGTMRHFVPPAASPPPVQAKLAQDCAAK
ncbi:MAG: pyrimidine-nucleoside phosphorylase [Oscillospiraceae bacterium]